SGDVWAFKLDEDGSVDGDEPAWKASALRPAPQDRQLFTYHQGSGQGVPLRWEQMGPANQKLITGGSEAVIDYLRGDTRMEGPNEDQLRERNGQAFADFINGQPRYVRDHVNHGYGALPNLPSYAEF